jgi:hypothetical protein
MKKIPKDKLVAALKILYKLWNREHDTDSDWPSRHNIEWESGVPYDFFTKYSKQLGLGNDADDYYYWMNALEENEDNLDNETLTVDNVIVPKYYTFDVETYEDRVEQVHVIYEGQVEGYFNEDQLSRSFYELGQGEVFDYYDFRETDRDYGDGEGNGIELRSITMVSDVIPESNKKRKVMKESKLDSFIDSLNESETKFLIEKLQKKLL